jgi:hypothetical protein
MTADQQQLSQPAELHRYCRRCHRRLKSERSMKAGFGPVCILKEAQERICTGPPKTQD